MSLSIRDIPLDERHDVGRRLYEARSTPMPWHSACRWVLDCGDINSSETASLVVLAKRYAEAEGKAWPPPAPKNWPSKVWRRRDPFIAREHKKQILESLAVTGASFREWRTRLGLSVEELSARSGVSAGTVRGFENGRDVLAKVRTMIWEALNEYAASLPPARDWLILTDHAA
jgi:hypothetical protein